MQIHQLQRKTKKIKHVQIGRGGRRGKTSGRGNKGQKARSGRKLRPEWRDIIKKLPKMRGRGKHINKSFRERNVAVNLTDLVNLPKEISRITPQVLFTNGLISKTKGKLPRIKIVGNLEISRKFEIKNCSLSVLAKKNIESAGGKII